MAKVLLIGGSKFIGKTILNKLHSQNHDIIVINRGTIASSEYLPVGVKHHKVDRNNEEELRGAIGNESFDIVFDICAITKDHVVKILKVIEGNVQRHVHVSSGSVYDTENVLSVPVDEDHPFPELKEDTHPYVVSKTEAEIELFQAFNDRQFPMTIVRPTYVYGPDNYVYREAYFFDRIDRERSILLPEKGEGYFDLIHVEDLADLIIKLGFAKADKVLGEAFNGSRSYLMSANMYAKQVAIILNKKLDIVYYTHDMLKELKWPEEKFIFPYMPTGVFNMSNEKVCRVLDFHHKYNYEDGLKSAYDWWIDQNNSEPEWSLENSLINYIKTKEGNKSEQEIEKSRKLLIEEIQKFKDEIAKK
jgi:nucleoside-diphosphate-sugar epimerase